MTSTERLDRIVANLLRVVPDPPGPIARPTASFAGLKVGQRLRPIGGRLCPPDLVYEVTTVDSLGANLAELPYKQAYAVITERNWKESWSRVRAPRKPRKKKG